MENPSRIGRMIANETNITLNLIQSESVDKLSVFTEIVIPAKAGIQCFQKILDAGSTPA